MEPFRVHFRQLKMFRFFTKLLCCKDSRRPRGSGATEYSNYTDNADYIRRSPRNVSEHNRRLPMSARSASSSRLNDLNESSSTSTMTSRRGHTVEMSDFILISVRKDEKFT